MPANLEVCQHRKQKKTLQITIMDKLAACLANFTAQCKHAPGICVCVLRGSNLERLKNISLCVHKRWRRRRDKVVTIRDVC